jgi:HlyD family secretion protein
VEEKLRAKLLLVLAVAGILGGLASAYLLGAREPPPPPLFTPAQNPYTKGVYANGIIESYQSNGANINIFPEVPGTITQVLVAEGAAVARGTPLLLIDGSIQKAVVEQQKAQAAAALALLQELKAQPRKEVLEVSKAQVEVAAANLKTSQDQLSKQKKSFELDPQSVSRDQLDNAENAARVAKANLDNSQRQYELTRAGAWIYDIQNQQHQYEALIKTYESGSALLDKYTIRAPVDGVILAVNAAAGSFISTQGAYGTYTEGFGPVIVMAQSDPYFQVRCYIDEILIPRLPPPAQMNARMYVRGTNTSIPLEFVRVQPYVTPKIELSNQRNERVDVRVLPVVFRFETPKETHVYPGQLVDVYLEAKSGE